MIIASAAAPVNPAHDQPDPADDPFAPFDGWRYELGPDTDPEDTTDYTPGDEPSDDDRAEWAAITSAGDDEGRDAEYARGVASDDVLDAIAADRAAEELYTRGLLPC